MNAYRLKHRVSLPARAAGKDALNADTPGREEVMPLWAAIDLLNGREPQLAHRLRRPGVRHRGVD